MHVEKITIFGISAYHLYFDKGDKSPSHEFTKNNDYTSGLLYYVKGNPSVVVSRTNEVIDSRKPGMFTSEMPKPVNYDMNEFLGFIFHEDTEWICLPYKNNNLPFPEFKTLVIRKDNNYIIPNNTKIFLAKGSVSANGKILGVNKEIIIKSSDVEFKALEDTYLLIVK